jgi:hypothetical protein
MTIITVCLFLVKSGIHDVGITRDFRLRHERRSKH